MNIPRSFVSNLALGMSLAIGVAASAQVTINTGSATNVYVAHTNNGVGRWVTGMGGTESGGNAGSDLRFDNYNDAGTQISTAMILQRSTGNVGIGTTSPDAKLEIAIGDNGGLNIEQTGAGQTGYLTFRDSDGGLDGRVSYDHFNNSMRLVTAGSERVRVDASGNVGIGTLGPQARLHVLQNSDVSEAWLRIEDQDNTPNSMVPNIEFYGNGTRLGELRFNDAYGFQVRNGAQQSQLTVSVGGNVGISNISPGRRLEVNHDLGLASGEKFIANFTQLAGQNGLYLGYRANGSAVSAALIRADNNLPITFGTSASNEAVTILNSGYVGIGTTSITSKLTLEGAVLSQDVRFKDSYGYITYNLNPTDNGGGTSGTLKFRTGDGIERIRFDSTGNVGIGTTNPGAFKLAVKGKIRAEEVIVDTGWSDYVFADDYRLAPLAEVEAHIRDKKHLPGIPSAAEVEEGGVSLGDMQAKMMAKIEELTLHVIAQEKRMESYEKENATLRQQVSELRAASNP